MLRVLVVGVGRMGFAHAKAAQSLPDVEIIGLVARDWQKWQDVARYFAGVPLYNDFREALHFTKPDAVIISSYTDTHALYATQAMEAGAHVFVEKPLALNKREAGHTIATARKTGRKLFVGYILRHHALWKAFVTAAKSLGAPYKATFYSNQHSTGDEWQLHKNILSAGLSPLVDCGIHYADLMSQISGAEVINIRALGYKTTPDIAVPNETNMMVSYADGSNLYFESGFGPNIALDDYATKRVDGAHGSVEITQDNLLVHNGKSVKFDDSEYDKAILAQQKAFFDAIKSDINLEQHWQAVALSLATVLIAEEEMRIS